ncbi:SusD/RagB family nutrient-binding outer membrane lipoprotein [Cytophaga sp. FL35]|uniref:SusD/RagB family nutrient-binding outer membrane lipoprotein n=1 Tax=Cytophaga sp. FL35 TaxID=1904456 RepID=UPI001653EB5A|nr:SusD/RagB family nutrient-binding outer membrane lipoprotein [Cytophaga sp. FL35]MBC6997280.1 SusD/RagB family nutrient-binding outer membrane lipoprotein [Cytophaga sp. FL35]
MKNSIITSILAVFVLLASTACEDNLEELYQDPDGFSKGQADEAGVSIIAGYFTSQLTRGFFLRGEYGAHYHQLRSGSRVMGTGVQLYYTTNVQGVPYALANVENDWGSNGFNRTVFDKLNSDWIKQVLWAQKEYNKIAEEDRSKMDVLFMRLLHVLKAYAYQRAIDGYDEVPYFETGSAGALDGEKAQYLGQEEIYPIIIEELKGIEDYLATVDLDASELAIFQSQDVIFNGSLLQWRKYINSLRLRWAMTVSERLPDLTSTVLSELEAKPIFENYDDVAGLADIAIVEPNRLQVELGITRAFRERGDESRAPKRYLQDVMHVEPTEKSVVINGETLYYFDGDNSEEGLANGTVDPRVAYLFSKDILGRYIGSETGWDNGTDPNSFLNKTLRAYYINHPIMTDISVTEISFGTEGGDEQVISLNDEAAADLSKREAFLLKAFREQVGFYRDTNYTIGTDNNLVAEFNTRPQYNFDLRYPTLHAVETQLSLAEAAVRGFGSGSASSYYQKAIELSCNYWYLINVDNRYSKQTTPSFPSTMDETRIARDRASEEYDAAAYAAFEAQRFEGLTDQEKVHAIFNQLQLHYNMFNFEVPWTSARRLINYLGGENPGSPYEIFTWKERFLYNPGIQATDPEAWAIISQHDDPGLPMWFTGRTAKWRNTLE